LIVDILKALQEQLDQAQELLDVAQAEEVEIQRVRQQRQQRMANQREALRRAATTLYAQVFGGGR